MQNIELVPENNYCIESIARKKHHEYVNLLLSNKDVTNDLKIKTEILRKFIETTDFRRLRAKYEPYIQRGDKIKFIIYTQDDKLKYKIEVLS